MADSSRLTTKGELMNIKRILCLMFCLLFIVSTFTGCVENDEQVGKTDNNTTGVSDTPVEDENNNTSDIEFLDIVKDGVAVDVIYPKNAVAGELTAANSIVSSLKNLGRVNAKAKEETSYDKEKVEIVVGKTDYAESKTVIDNLNYSEGIITVVENKIIVAAYGEETYSTLSTRFTMALSNGKYDGNNIRIATNYTVTVSDNDLVSSLPVVKNTSPHYIKDAGDGSYVLMFKSATSDMLDSYISALVADGYTEYASNAIDSNRYYTYINAKNVVNVAFTDYNDEMKVIAERLTDTALPTREADNKWTAATGITTTISQLGLYYEYNGKNDYFNGMSYVIRLKDGSFIVIDGGHDKQIDSDRLYNVMRKQSPDPDNIVIAAWFFTHGHSDHTGFFKSFCQTYASKVTVEQFVYNFPSIDEVNDATQIATSGNLDRYFKNVPIVKAHPGQAFYLRNAKITMLYTNDLWEHSLKPLSTSNEASLVFTVELEDKKFMVLGDYYDDRGILRSLYSASTLKSDIMQVSHHGISNCGSKLYPIIAPEWALWPLGSDYIEEYDRVISEHQMNAYMKTMDKNKVFMAKDDIVILTLDNGNITAQVFETDAIYLAS